MMRLFSARRASITAELRDRAAHTHAARTRTNSSGTTYC
jgi:hypothetical protein